MPCEYMYTVFNDFLLNNLEYFAINFSNSWTKHNKHNKQEYFIADLKNFCLINASTQMINISA